MKYATWLCGVVVTSPAESRGMTSVPYLTSCLAFRCGNVLTSKKRSRTSMSYPSSCRRFRSGLRTISGFDIEDHPIFDLYGLTCGEDSLRVHLRPVVIGHGVKNVLSRRRHGNGQLHHLLERHTLLLHL